MLLFFYYTPTQRCVSVLVTQTGGCPSLTLVFIAHKSTCTPSPTALLVLPAQIFSSDIK